MTLLSYLVNTPMPTATRTPTPIPPTRTPTPVPPAPEPAAYDETYTYDLLGNLTSKDGIGYGYGATGTGAALCANMIETTDLNNLVSRARRNTYDRPQSIPIKPFPFQLRSQDRPRGCAQGHPAPVHCR